MSYLIEIDGCRECVDFNDEYLDCRNPKGNRRLCINLRRENICPRKPKQYGSTIDLAIEAAHKAEQEVEALRAKLKTAEEALVAISENDNGYYGDKARQALATIRGDKNGN